MNKYINCINYLIQKKTNTIKHCKSNLFNHLMGTFNILRKWDCSEDTCFAGLFHSIYGNDYFTIKTEGNREVIKSLIGEKSEELVYLFNTDIKRNINREVSIISFANNLEQGFFNVFDNLYDQKDIDDYYFYFRDTVPWKFLGSGEWTLSKWRKFTYVVEGKHKLEKKLKEQTENILKQLNVFDFLTLQRVYASANPYGTVHDIHQDYGTDLHKGITVMYYLNRYWEPSYAGETVFLNVEKNDIIKSILPKPGRVIMFDGGCPHGARDTRRDVNDLRMVLTFKYKINVL